MKSIYLFGTRLLMYWVMLPVGALLGLCIAYNKHAENLFKFYPLIIASILGLIFIFIYFFRVIRISYDEIRYIGLFTSRDSAVINEGKTLIIERGRGKRLKVSLFGNDGVLADLDWLKSTGDAPRDISLFRGKAIGGERAVRKVLKFFAVGEDDIKEILLGGMTSYENELILLEVFEDDDKETIKIKMLTTI